jgi:hypothetical protein
MINFPDNPVDGQTFMVSNILYEYYSVKSYWRVLKTNDVVDGGSSILSSTNDINYDGGGSNDEGLESINNLNGGTA